MPGASRLTLAVAGGCWWDTFRNLVAAAQTPPKCRTARLLLCGGVVLVVVSLGVCRLHIQGSS